MKKKTKKIVLLAIKFAVKYLLPAIAGWIEGDTHYLQDLLSVFADICTL